MKGGRGGEEEEPVGTELDLSMGCSEGSHLVFPAPGLPLHCRAEGACTRRKLDKGNPPSGWVKCICLLLTDSVKKLAGMSLL